MIISFGWAEISGPKSGWAEISDYHSHQVAAQLRFIITCPCTEQLKVDLAVL